MEVKLYFRMLQRSWWIIALTTLAAVIVALVASYFATPVYQATSRFILSPDPTFLSGNDVLNSLDVLDRRSIITTYSEVLNSPRIYRETLQLLQLSEQDVLKYTYTATVLTDTNVIELVVEGPDPTVTASLANSIGQRAIDYVQNLYQAYDLTLLDPAVVPVIPIRPQPLQNAGIALVVGLALGIGLALVRELVRTPIENFMQQRKLDEMSQALKRDAFSRELADTAFASTRDFSLCMVHLDGLSEYIDVLPQPTLQTILRHVNQTLKNQLRGNDLVGRWGDVDFAVLLSETPGDGALNTMGRVKTALSIPIKIDISGDDLYLQPEIGVAEYRVGDTGESLMDNANWALERARKGDGGIYLLRANEQI
jgi:diguanylate cyclase (GGDEF)-like protein